MGMTLLMTTSSSMYVWCRGTSEWASKGLALDPRVPYRGDPPDEIWVYQINLDLSGEVALPVVPLK